MASKPIEIEVGGTVHRVTVERDPAAAECLRVCWGEVVRLVDARRLDVQTLSFVGTGEDATSFEARVLAGDSRGTLDVTINGVLVRASVNAGRSVADGGPGGRGQRRGKAGRRGRRSDEDGERTRDFLPRDC